MKPFFIFLLKSASNFPFQLAKNNHEVTCVVMLSISPLLKKVDNRTLTNITIFIKPHTKFELNLFCVAQIFVTKILTNRWSDKVISILENYHLLPWEVLNDWLAFFLFANKYAFQKIYVKFMNKREILNKMCGKSMALTR